MLFFKINVRRPLSILPLIEMLLPTSELLKISLRLIPTPQILLSSSAPIHDFKNKFVFSFATQDLGSRSTNIIVTVPLVLLLKPGPSPHFILPTLTPIASHAVMRMQPRKMLKACGRAVGWPRRLPAGHNSVGTERGSSFFRGSQMSVRTRRTLQPLDVLPHALLPTLQGPFLGPLMHPF